MIRFYLLLIPFFSLGYAHETTFKESNEIFHQIDRRQELPASKEYPYNPHVPFELWIELKPYFLPAHHPIKKKLDAIFLGKRVTLSKETFVEAGFSITRRNRPLNAVVTGHKQLKGYLVKAYLDSQLATPPDWQMWLKRIKGVEVIKACLKKHGLSVFVLPKKWIYPLPAEPSPPLDTSSGRKNFILIVEDMCILDNKDNEQAYKKKITRRLLKSLYTVMSECRLADCVYIGNMPFTENGKIAFIDTEIYLGIPPDFKRFKKYLSIPMQEYLDKLIQENMF